MSLIGPARFYKGNVLKGTIDASLAANLPSSPQIGDRYRVSVAGTFGNDASILPNGYSFTINDGIEWNGTNWIAQESGSDVWITGGTITGITDLAVADGGTGASDAANARTNLGLGTISTQDSNNVNITGGSVTGITDLALADGGTGASDAPTARTNLGLGSISTQDSTSVNITGGTITGITDLALADGGTGASDAPNARINLGLGSMSTQDSTTVSITGGSITGITDLAIADGGTGASDAATARTNLSVPATDPTGVTGADQITNIMSLTQAEFDAIITPDPATLYVITDATPTMTETQTNAIAIKYAIALG